MLETGPVLVPARIGVTGAPESRRCAERMSSNASPHITFEVTVVKVASGVSFLLSVKSDVVASNESALLLCLIQGDVAVVSIKIVPDTGSRHNLHGNHAIVTHITNDVPGESVNLCKLLCLRVRATRKGPV